MIHVVMGSKDSDLPVIKESKMPSIYDQLCADLDIGAGFVKYHACSAHRNPKDLQAFVDHELASSEPSIFIGIAGLAAALPGALAGANMMSHPVIAVPLDQFGLDSCLRMAPGVPVLTTGVGKHGITGAAIASLQMYRLKSAPVGDWLDRYIKANTKPAEFDIDINVD